MLSLQTAPNLFSIFDIKPVLIVPLVVCVCMFENIMPSAVFSVIAGLFWDMSSNKLIGFNAIIMLAMGTLIA
ncbi:MAG: hypothetical protein RSE93_08950, partial [Oscillospiraceae bacterium]